MAIKMVMDFAEFNRQCDEILLEYEKMRYTVKSSRRYYPKQYICYYVRMRNETTVIGRLDLDICNVKIQCREMDVTEHMGMLGIFDGEEDI